MTNLKSLLQLPIKADQRGTKDCCEMKGECVHVSVCVHVCERASEVDPIGMRRLKGTLSKYLSQQVTARERHYNAFKCAASEL